MCDYSLEMYRSQPVREGVEYRTHRFPSHTVGLVSPADPQTAVCVQCGMQMRLDGIPADIRRELGVGDTESVTFIRIEEGLHHDGVAFANGQRVPLQRLGPDIRVTVTDALAGPHLPQRTAETA